MTAYLKDPDAHGEYLQQDIDKKIRYLADVMNIFFTTHTDISQKEKAFFRTILKPWNIQLSDPCTDVSSSTKKRTQETLDDSKIYSPHNSHTKDIPETLNFLSRPTRKLAQEYMVYCKNFFLPLIAYVSPSDKKVLIRHWEFTREMMNGYYDSNEILKKSLCYNIYYLLDTLQTLLLENQDIPLPIQQKRDISIHRMFRHQRKELLRIYEAQERKKEREQI